MIRGNVDVSQRDEHARTAKRGFVFIVTRGFQSRSAALHGSTLFRKLLELKLTQRGWKFSLPFFICFKTQQCNETDSLFVNLSAFKSEKDKH